MAAKSETARALDAERLGFTRMDFTWLGQQSEAYKMSPSSTREAEKKASYRVPVKALAKPYNKILEYFALIKVLV